jgi:hypothetical protein
MKADVQREHRWLQQLVGEWTYEGECAGEPGQPSQKWRGTETVRTVGDAWVLCEGHGQMPDGDAATTLVTLGYDPQRHRFVGTFIGSMMSFLWIYEGTLDAAERALSLHAEGPSMAGDGSMAKYQDVVEITGENARTLTSYVRADGGEWRAFMTAHYRRKR